MDFVQVVKTDRLVQKNSNNAWKAQVQHFHENLRHLETDVQVKEVYKTLEKQQKEEQMWKPSNVYMSNKSVIIRAKRLSVALMDGDKVRGKSDVQNDCNAAEDNTKTAFEKYQQALLNAAKYLDKIDPSQIPGAYVAAKELFAKVNDQAVAQAEARKAA